MGYSLIDWFDVVLNYLDLSAGAPWKSKDFFFPRNVVSIVNRHLLLRGMGLRCQGHMLLHQELLVIHFQWYEGKSNRFKLCCLFRFKWKHLVPAEIRQAAGDGEKAGDQQLGSFRTPLSTSQPESQPISYLFRATGWESQRFTIIIDVVFVRNGRDCLPSGSDAEEIFFLGRTSRIVEYKITRSTWLGN